MTDDPRILIPYDRREAISVRAAAVLTGKSEQTIRNWCEQHHIGRRIAGGHLQISKPALQMLLDGDKAALDQYQAGDRTSERVAQYFRRAGIAQKAKNTQEA